MKLNKFLFLLLLTGILSAQQNTTAKLEQIHKDGLQKIYLPSGILSFSNENLGDFRIYDSRGNEVPYAFPAQNFDSQSYQFKPFHIVSKTTAPKKSTSIVIENPLQEISELTLYMANAEVTKKFSISGSNDQSQWFGLVNSRELSDLTKDSSNLYRTIPLPVSNYRFLRIDFDDKKTLPINVLSAGYFDLGKKQQRRFETIRPKMTTVQDKAKKVTRIHVLFQNRQPIQKIAFGISAPNFYKRQTRIYKNTIYKIRKRTATREENLAGFELNSGKPNTFETSGLSEKEFFIEIDNRDNPPLALSKIEFSQQLFYVIADLKADEKYTVKTGDSKMAVPDYDLSETDYKMSDGLPEAKITQIKHGNTNVAAAHEKTLWQQPWFMWLCIGLGGIAILYFTVSLVKDMK
ncbi:MAG TPA: DUF3999 family protein [Flavobacterium sp.]|nr:DUF3999 family protein [Flavobacterium sp.]